MYKVDPQQFKAGVGQWSTIYAIDSVYQYIQRYYLSMKPEKPKICSQQARDPGEPMVSVISSQSPSPKARKTDVPTERLAERQNYSFSQF